MHGAARDHGEGLEASMFWGHAEGAVVSSASYGFGVDSQQPGHIRLVEQLRVLPSVGRISPRLALLR